MTSSQTQKRQLIFGALLVVAGALFIVLGQAQFLGYAQEHYLLFAIVGLGLPGAGAWIWARHWQDLQKDIKRGGLGK